jgi:hypothetical protein
MHREATEVEVHIAVIQVETSSVTRNSTAYFCLRYLTELSAIVCVRWVVAKQITVTFRHGVWNIKRESSSNDRHEDEKRRNSESQACALHLS